MDLHTIFKISELRDSLKSNCFKSVFYVFVHVCIQIRGGKRKHCCLISISFDFDYRCVDRLVRIQQSNLLSYFEVGDYAISIIVEISIDRSKRIFL